jgi:hypothetical protein
MPEPMEEIALRVRVVAPPAGVRFAVQSGREGLVPPASESPEEIVFEVVARAGGDGEGGVRLLGPYVQGRPGDRFIYVNSGTCAGDATSCWTRRAKVPLASITRACVEAARGKKGGALEAAIAGRAKDGGPACASVPLLGGGFRVVTRPRAR